jgi:hypothetical protein
MTGPIAAAVETHRLFVGGTWEPTASGRVLPVRDDEYLEHKTVYLGL